MKNFRLLILLLPLLSSCKTTRYTHHAQPAVSNTRSEYIAAFSDIAIREMHRTGIPASIKMAQAILESGDGNSRLARQANNHFGIKCHDWTGRRIYHDDDARNECFRRYNNPEESFFDHSDFLTGRPRYAALFDLDPHDYRGWARGLKAAGYATNPDYDRLLIRIIEDNSLYRLDRNIAVSSSGMRSGSENTVVISSTPAGREVLRRNRIRYIIARPGDTVEKITGDMGLMRWELPRYNEFPEGHRISPGDIIYLQPKRTRAERGVETHLVREGETLYMISQLYGIRLSRLINFNDMEQETEPKPGQVLFLRNTPRHEDTRILRPEFEL